MSPSCRVGDEADDEEHPGEGLHGAADGEDGAADAAPAADGQQREQVSDHLKKHFLGHNIYIGILIYFKDSS